MITQAINKPSLMDVQITFPISKLCTNYESTRTILGLGFSGFLICRRTPKYPLIYALENNPINYRVFVIDAIPYLLLSIANTGIILAGSYHAISSDIEIDTWLLRQDTRLTLFLADTYSKQLKASRELEISQDAIRLIKENCQLQRQVYPDKASIINKMQTITQAISPGQMWEQATNYD